VTDSVTYATLAVLVCLLLWRGSNTVEGQERKSRTASLTYNFGRRCACFCRLAVRAAGLANCLDSQDKTITVFAAASMTNGLDAADLH